ncbi:DUF3139 domain-containing protein [Solibacillus sp. MA9]|uniref:DUF3139 domain-containing protein n=1 Tax=Solibacillus palustris TaxID=2908203 RepID=A0ABS9U7K0_9BACL|nr:DUF3139 domain-containing protein [Solibacillus sp. MA9]MCH7320326.1 DUF3139 domain-containing protein [Solibacillus sp. MA9]
MKKWLFIIPALIITGFVLFGYNEFNGNFLSKQIAKSTLKSYLAEEYTDINYQFDKGFYDFKLDTYTFDVTFYEAQTNWTYTFEVGPKLIPTAIQTKTLHYDSKDEVISTLWSEQGSQYVKNLLADIPVGGTSYNIDVPKQFSQAGWSPTVDVPVAPSITIEFPLYKGESKETFFNHVQDIQKALNADGIRYDSVFVYMDEKFDNRDGKKEGYAPIYYERRYSLHFQANAKITLDDIQ